MTKRFTLLFLLLSKILFSQTFTGATGSIPDNNTVKDFNVTVSGLANSSNQTTFGLEKVCISIFHYRQKDIDAKLVAPDGTIIQLFSQVDTYCCHFTSTCFDATATDDVGSVIPPHTGTFKPTGNLWDVNNGQNPNGVWKLRIQDMVPSNDWGNNLDSWSISFGSTPAAPPPPFTSNLPIVIITTNNGASIPDDPKVAGTIKTVNNAVGINSSTGPFQYEGKIGIEQRGSSSSGFPKKSYGFETWNDLSVSIDTTLLGMPAESDWTLIANYTDKSMMNNMLAYKLYDEMGHYAPRTRYCEVILNEVYIGVYLMTEKIKRDSNRVSIAKLKPTDIAGDDVTGGYIIKIDKTTGSGGGQGWTSQILSTGGKSINYQYEYPKSTDINNSQKTYIKNFMDEFEANLDGAGYADPLTGYRKYIKLRGFLDYFILGELSRNVDGFRLSTYVYKEKITDGNKISLVPWDYDLAFHNADYCDGFVVEGWHTELFNSSLVCQGDPYHVPFWWSKLMQDQAFQNDLRCRYEYLRTTVLETSRLHNVIDSVALVLNDGQARNFQKYPILGTYIWPNPSPVPSTYAGEVTELKEWLTDRLVWMDANVPGTCVITSVEDETNDRSLSGATANPNPFESNTVISWESAVVEDIDMMVVNSLGTVVLQKRIRTAVGENLFSVNLENADPGLYVVHLNNGSSTESVKMLRK